MADLRDQVDGPFVPDTMIFPRSNTISNIMVEKLSAEQARHACPEMVFDCASTAELTPLEQIIGQDRAVRALQFGLNIDKKGFNVFVSGLPGTGRKTAVLDFVRELAAKLPTPSDWCYVNNFKDSSRPNAIRLPPGKGIELKKAMEEFVNHVPVALREAFEGEDYSKRRDAVMQKVNRERNDIIASINRMAKDSGFSIQVTAAGFALVPLVEGRPLTDQEFLELPEALQKQINQAREAVNARIGDAFRPLRDIAKKADKEMSEMNKEIARFAISPYLDDMREQFKGIEEVDTYIDEVENDILESLPLFLAPPKDIPIDPTRNYHVNLVVDNSQTKGAPAEIELNPTYIRLFGYSERESRMGALITDYTMVRAGTAHKANGGFLVIPAEQMFRDPLVWEGLKQMLSSERLEMEDPVARMGYMVTKTLRPEPIPFDGKVIIIGSPQVYQILYTMDPDFRELFKVKAEFETTMERTKENLDLFASFVCALCRRENLHDLDSSALAALVEHSSRIAGDQNKLTTQFAKVADVIREANYYADLDGVKVLNGGHIRRAIEERVYRSNMIQEKIVEMIHDGTLLIDVAGSKVGQVNGLAVLSTGDYSFGRPSRITATVGVGREGIIDIERQAQLSGTSHTKGVLIVSGLINSRYAIDAPLSLSARLVFEQSYSGVDGDSASSTELYALLSALSEVPVKQYIAVTGSVNQRGEVQAIGGVNEKVEGYFEVCKLVGLTGEQGVMIPKSNVRNLMLKEEVVEAIREGRFHIWPVATIDEGIEVLTGVEAGVRNEDGSYPPGTINAMVQERLLRMAERIKEYHP